MQTGNFALCWGLIDHRGKVTSMILRDSLWRGYVRAEKSDLLSRLFTCNDVPCGTLRRRRDHLSTQAEDVPRGTSSACVPFGASTETEPGSKKLKNGLRERVVFHHHAVFASRRARPSISDQSSFPTGVCLELVGWLSVRFPQPRPVSHNASPCARRDFSLYSGMPWERSSESSTKRAA